MQRARTRSRLRLVRPSRRQLGGGDAEAIDVNAVAAQIVDVNKAAVGRVGNEMRVRGLLAFLVGTLTSVVLGPNGGAQPAVGNGEAGSGAAAVVGRDQHFASKIERHIA